MSQWNYFLLYAVYGFWPDYVIAKEFEAKKKISVIEIFFFGQKKLYSLFHLTIYQKVTGLRSKLFSLFLC